MNCSNIQVTYEQRYGKQLSAWQAYKTLPNMKALWQGSAFNLMKYSYGWISFLTQHSLMMNYLQNHGYNKSAGSLAALGCDAAIAVVNAPFMNALDVMYNKVTGDRPEGMKAFFRGTPQGCMLSLFAVIGRGWTMQRIEQLNTERELLSRNVP